MAEALDILQDEEILLSQQILATMEAYLTEFEGNIAYMKTSGMTDKAIKDRLLVDLEREGRLFSPIKSNLKNSVKSAINGASSEASNRTQQAAGITEFTWVTISAKPCPDCDDRAGETGTMEFWEAAGKPKSGFSVCGTNCKCRLVASSKNPPGEVVREKK